MSFTSLLSDCIELKRAESHSSSIIMETTATWAP
jgi:hypothetical protein